MEESPFKLRTEIAVRWYLHATPIKQVIHTVHKNGHFWASLPGTTVRVDDERWVPDRWRHAVAYATRKERSRCAGRNAEVWTAQHDELIAAAARRATYLPRVSSILKSLQWYDRNVPGDAAFEVVLDSIESVFKDYKEELDSVYSQNSAR